MGDNADKKKIRVTYFIMRNQMNFQNISIHGSKHAMHMKATNGQKLQRVLTPTKFN